MAMKIGAGLALDGEKEFKSAVSGINKDLSVLASEMGKVTAKFGDNADSMEALTEKQKVYNKQADEQKKKVETLTAALENAKKEYGENSDKVKNWQISLNKAEADLAKTENSLKDTTDQIDNFGKEADDGGKSIETAGKKAKASGDDAEKGKSGWAKLGSGLSKVGELAGKAVLALGTAATGAAAGVGAMTIKAAANADEINTLAKKTGLSTEEIQKFQYASEQIDVDLDTLTGSMAKLTKNMGTAQKGTGDASKAFKALGVEITNQDGSLRDNQAVFNESINALGKMENGTQRDAYAMQIFGKSAQDLNPLILGGADALKTLGDEAEAAGLILGQDALDNLNNFQDSIDTFKATLSGSGSLFATAFAGPMSEGLNTITGYMQRLTASFSMGGDDKWNMLAEVFGEIIGDVIAKINENLPKILEFGLNIINKIVEGITQNVPALVESATNILMMLVNALLKMLPQLLKAGLEIIKELALGIAQALPELIPSIVDTVLTIVETLIDNVDMLVDAAIAIIVALADGLIAALPMLIEKAPVIIQKLVDAIIVNVPKVWAAAYQLIKALVGGIVENLPSLGTAALDIINTLTDGLDRYFNMVVDIGKNIVTGIWDGIKSMAAWFGEQVSNFFGNIVNNAKKSLGIHSPSTVFAGIGENMAAGLGVGFASEMQNAARQIQGSIPTKLNMSGNYSVGTAASGQPGRSAVGNMTVVNIYADKELAKVYDLFNSLRQTQRQGAY